MISGVHTDAISTFVDDGQLALGSKADVDEQFGVRFAADDVWFHLEGDARTPIPPTHPFIGTVGSDAWIAEEVNPGPGRLWPGFSTEVEPADAVTGDTTFTLTGLQGPGELEVYAQGGLGTVERLWSSRGTTFRSFSLPRVHRHANWAFTAAGVYRLTVEATAVVQGQSQTARATYTFVVGDVAPAETTTTRLTVDADPVVATRPTTLSATVTPASVVGAVEFRDGETVLGHAPVADGRASLSTTLPRLGSRTLTARFVPTVANHFAASTSDPVEVTVQEDDDAEPLGIAGIERTYQPGEIIDLRLTGVTLEPGQTTLWRLYRKNQGSYLALSYGNTTMSHQLEATQALDGAEILVDILPPGAIAPLLSIQNTGRQKFKIGGSGGGSGEPVAIRGLANEAYRGDPIQVDVEHRELADDESGRWVRRQIGRYGQYQWVATTTDVVGSGPYRISTGSTGFGGWEYAYQLRDAEGSVLGQSPAVQPTLRTRELSISGLLGVYREGQSIRARANLYPERDDVEYQWGPANVVAGTPFAGRVAADEELVLPTTLAMNGRSLSATAYDATTGEEISSASSPLRVIEADGERVLLMGDLNSHGDHSHSFDRIFLRAYPEPVAADDDRFQ